MSKRKHRHSLKSQFYYAIEQQHRHGISKRADARNGMNVYDYVYGIQTDETLRKVAQQLATFVREHYPEIRYVKDITADMVQAMVVAKEGQWTQRTGRQKLSALKKLNHLINQVYKCDVDFCSQVEVTATKGSNRVKAVNVADLSLIRVAAAGGRSPGKHGIELQIRAGLRSCEVVRLLAEEIDLDTKILHLGNYCKNGRRRDVPIRPGDLEYFQHLKDTVGSGKIVPVTEKSYIGYLNRIFQRAGVAEKYHDTKGHALRKTYATMRMKELRGDVAADPRTDQAEREAWEIVQQELGHGPRFRPELYNTYVKKNNIKII